MGTNAGCRGGWAYMPTGTGVALNAIGKGCMDVGREQGAPGMGAPIMGGVPDMGSPDTSPADMGAPDIGPGIGPVIGGPDI